MRIDSRPYCRCRGRNRALAHLAQIRSTFCRSTRTRKGQREISRLGLIRSKHDASALVAREWPGRPSAPPPPLQSLTQDQQYLNPRLDSIYLENLIDAAQHRARSRGSKVVSPRDVNDAAATVAAEGRGLTPQKAPAIELPEHYDEMILNLRALGTVENSYSSKATSRNVR